MLMGEFNQDAEMIKAAERALTALLDSPLNFGATCTEANKEAWRFTRPWPRMLADHLNSILVMDPTPATAQDEISDTLSLIVLLSNKLAFVYYHKRNLAKRMLGPLKEFHMELERFVVSSLIALGYNEQLLRPTSSLIANYSYKNPGEGGEGGRVGGGGGGGVGGGGVLPKAPPIEFDFLYLSKSLWKQCGVW